MIGTLKLLGPGPLTQFLIKIIVTDRSKVPTKGHFKKQGFSKGLEHILSCFLVVDVSSLGFLDLKFGDSSFEENDYKFT